ncbi:MAG: beta-ketoacyl synthase N-terminal-like domain-containing protein [Anaerolineaceae bacterium]|nr:beta-ketoacyl synthase N-terminal-like domain-containing protein [Anaerolineaceae bacterium]
MNQVYITGIGQVPVKESWETSLKELAGFAGIAAMEDAANGYPEGLFVGNMLSLSANKQGHFATQLADWLGFHHKPALNIEAACGSGAAAFRAALEAVASGELESALVIGAEKMTDSPSSEITSQLATAADADLEAGLGLSFVAINALVMQRYIFEHHWTPTDFAAFSINAHANAVHNPYARFRKTIDLNAYQKAAMVCDPINLLDATPIADGAAAIVISKNPGNGPFRPLRVIGSASATDSISIQNRKDPTWLGAAEKSARAAYSQSGIQPKDIGVFEYHDAFSIMAALSLEACGFCPRGEGPRLANEGRIKFDADIPVATLGGLKARGHPVGATGIYQLCELTLQLRGQAGPTQVRRPYYGMAQNIGGSGSNITTHILEAE